MATARWENLSANEYGYVGRLQIVRDGTPVDLSSYTTTEFVFRKPDGTEFTRTATFSTDGSDGLLQYTIAEGDITTAGRWQVKAHIARVSPAADLYSRAARFQVS